MNKKLTTKLFNLFAILLLTFSLFSPVSLSAESSQSTKEESFEKIRTIKNLINEQESKLQRQGEIDQKLLNKVKTLSANETVSVIVQLSEAPVSLEIAKSKLQGRSLSLAAQANVKQSIQAQQTGITNQLTANDVNFTLVDSFSRTLNAVVLKTNVGDLEKIANIPGVVRVELDDEMHALEIHNSEQVGTHMDNSNNHLDIPEIWATGNEGAGVKVAVVDTGVDYTHPDLKDIYKGGKNFVEHDSDYARDRDENDPYETTPEDRASHMAEFDEHGNSFYTSHGTHVAGIIAGAGNNDYDIKGVAPKIDLYAYRVLGAYGSGLMTWVIGGIEQAVEDGVDIINLSLGGGSNHEDDATSIAVNNATLEGVVVVSATGNSGPGLGSIGTPATSPLGIAVGNSTLPEASYSATVNVEAGDYDNSSDIELMAWTFGENLEETLAGEFELVAIPGLGEPEDFEGLDVDGKVALISRGDIPFVDKIEAAREAGAVATLIHNNVGTGPADVYLGDAFTWIPSFDMATEEGEALRAALEESSGTVTFTDVEASVTAGDELNQTSSRGPTVPNYDIKPDVVAPGTNIMATVPAYGKDNPDANYDQAYDRKSGTSMAAPQVAGIAALLLAENSDWTSYDVKVALSNTAKPLNTNRYHVFEQGAGLVQPAVALNSNVLAYAQDSRVYDGEEVRNDKGTVTYGLVVPGEEEQTVTKVVDVKQLAGSSENFTVEVEYVRQASGTEVTVNKDEFTLSNAETLEVTLSVGTEAEVSGDETYGYIHINSETTQLSLPFAAVFNEVESGLISDLHVVDEAISLSGEAGVVNETELRFELLDIADTVATLLWDAQDPFGGPDEDGYIGYLGGGEFLMPSLYSLPIDGEYLNLETQQPATIEDGVYTLDLLALDLMENVEGDWVPFYVKSTTTEFEFDVSEEPLYSNESLTGLALDAFVDFKETADQAFGPGYDVNENLEILYTIVDENDETIVEEELLTLNDEGEFSIGLEGLTGEYTLYVSAEDIAGNFAEDSVEFEVEEVLVDYELFLTPSTTEETTDPVTVTVDSDSEGELVSVKWLPGERTAEDFVEEGTEVDLETLAFEVEENGVYTVYSVNEFGVESLATITIDNIVEPEEAEVSLIPSTTEETTDPVTVTVEYSGEDELVSVKWLAGERSVEDFAEEGTAVDLETLSFEVAENGVYTVYALNSLGVEFLTMITIDNIVEPEPEPEPTPDPEEPTDPEPEPEPEEPTDPEDEDEEEETPGEEDEEDTDGDTLPKTATPWYNFLLVGAILLVVGGLVIAARRFEDYLFYRV